MDLSFLCSDFILYCTIIHMIIVCISFNDLTINKKLARTEIFKTLNHCKDA
jgi:hypothetical protein